MSDVAPQTSFDTISCVKVEKNTIIAGTQDWYHLCVRSHQEQQQPCLIDP